MPALDTDALVRCVVEDDTAQLAAARRLIRKCVGEGRALFVPVTVALELEWVLRASFEYPKNAVMGVLSSLFSAAEPSFESEHALEVALQLYRDGSADVADCLPITHIEPGESEAAMAASMPPSTAKPSAGTVCAALSASTRSPFLTADQDLEFQ